MTPQEQLARFGVLLSLEQGARQAKDPSTLFFLMVNQTHQLIPYRQAFLWSARRRRTEAVSGLPAPSDEAPFIQWTRGLVRALPQPAPQGLVSLTGADLEGRAAEQWARWLPAQALWLPLADGQGGLLGGLLLAREEPFAPPEQKLLTYLADTYAHAWRALGGASRAVGAGRGRWRSGRSWLAAALVAGLAAASFLPVPLTVLGPAEVSPSRPAVIRSPLGGVIDRVLVEPNQEVAAGEVLVELDTQELNNRLAMAQQARQVEEVRLLQARQAALSDPRQAGAVAVQEAVVAERQAQVAFITQLLARASLKAPEPGVVVFGDRAELIGRPVQVGERIMYVAGKHQSKLVAWVSSQDAIQFQPGGRLDFFLNTRPDEPLAAVIQQVSFLAQPRPEGIMAYRVEAEFTGAKLPPRIGLRGVAKVYGEKVPLYYYVLRRPLTRLRQGLGW